MVRASLLAAAALFLLGAKRPPSVDYRLGVDSAAVAVEIRLAGDADGETRIALPAGLTGFEAKGAAATWEGPTTSILRHRPGARLTVRYRLPAPAGLRIEGGRVFAEPEGRARDAATFRWSRLPKGWTAASDLDGGRPLTVFDLRAATGLVGDDVTVVSRTLPNGTLRVAARGASAGSLDAPADALARLVAAERAYWNEPAGPAFIAVREAADADLPRAVALDHARAAIARLGAPPGGATAWWRDGVAVLVADRILLHAALASPSDVAGRFEAANRAPDGRGLLVALKWDDEVRRKTSGKADLDDVILRMRDHHRRFAPGQGPDIVTGLVSAAWVTAALDLRPDIARYASAPFVPLPETLFDGCLDARITVAPGFDSGFDHVASATAKAVKGVRRRGPAWNSGLRDGMRIDAIDLKAGDMTREIVLTVRPARGGGKPRTIRFWPYGDNDVETRRLQLATGLSDAALAACGRKLGGL